MESHVDMKELEKLALESNLEEAEQALEEEHISNLHLRDLYLQDARMHNSGYFATKKYTFRGGQGLDERTRDQLISKAYDCCTPETGIGYVLIQSCLMKIGRFFPKNVSKSVGKKDQEKEKSYLSIRR